MNLRRIFANRQSIYAVLVIGVLLLIFTNFWGFFFLKRVEKQILQQLKQQARHMGQITARLISGDDLEGLQPGMETTPPVLYYQQLLYEVRQSGDLLDIAILSLDRRMLVHHSVRYEIGQPFPGARLNDSLFSLASRGITPEPELLNLGGDYFLTTYTPILNDLGDVSAVLVTEVPTQFFAIMANYRRGLLYFGLSGMAIILIFAGIIVLAVRHLFAVEQQMQAQARLAELGQMAAMVAHEIRNPLSIMKGAAEVLRKKFAAQGEEAVDFISEEIDRLNRLVNDFLQFARPRNLNREQVDMRRLIEQLVGQLNDPRIHLTINDPCPSVWLDADAVKQVLLNILDNARQVVEEKGTIVVECFTTRQKPPRLVVSIKDNGPGMDEETLARVFEPFFSKSASGSGLGLTISRQLVEQMGGQIEIRSAPGKGTEVTLQFPVAS